MAGPGLLVAVVGPCAAGKSTLARVLRAHGYTVKELRQEHSVAPTMWQKFTHPDVLIYLDVSLEVAAQREGLTHPSPWWEEERAFRLAHARAHCDFYVDTSNLTPAQVAEQVLAFLAQRREAHPSRGE